MKDMNSNYPCDSGACPFSAESGNACRDNCGLGVDEAFSMDDIDELEREIREQETEADYWRAVDQETASYGNFDY